MPTILRETGEINTDVIYSKITENAAKLFPGVAARKDIMRCPGCIVITLTFPQEYAERQISLSTEPANYFNYDYNGIAVEINDIPDGTSIAEMDKYSKLLEALMVGLPEPKTPVSDVGTKSIFDNF